jgi:hypothetical protein
MPEPTLTTAFGIAATMPRNRLMAGARLSASEQGGLSRHRFGARASVARQARRWLGLALNLAGLAVLLQSLAGHGVGA